MNVLTTVLSLRFSVPDSNMYLHLLPSSIYLYIYNRLFRSALDWGNVLYGRANSVIFWKHSATEYIPYGLLCRCTTFLRVMAAKNENKIRGHRHPLAHNHIFWLPINNDFRTLGIGQTIVFPPVLLIGWLDILRFKTLLLGTTCSLGLFLNFNM